MARNIRSREEAHIVAPAGVTHQVVALGPEPLRVLRIDSRREDHSR